MMSSTWATSSAVRLSEAPSGSRMAAKKAPWSSAGRKPCGVILNSPSDAAADHGHRDQAEDGEAHQAPDDRRHSRRAPSRWRPGPRASDGHAVPPRFSSTEHKAGLSVSALIAEMIIAVDTATANWRKSWPLTPGMKATGTNTESSTSVMAMIGAVISAIAFLVASGMERSGSSSITRSTFSMTTMASSTTMPMASTSASRETVLAE